VRSVGYCASIVQDVQSIKYKKVAVVCKAVAARYSNFPAIVKDAPALEGD
jgi:hypothetical protein